MPPLLSMRPTAKAIGTANAIQISSAVTKGLTPSLSAYPAESCRPFDLLPLGSAAELGAPGLEVRR